MIRSVTHRVPQFILFIILLPALALAISCSTSNSEVRAKGGLEVAERLPAPATDLPLADKAGTTRKAVFAGGCFWCTEVVFETVDGISDVVSGYSGGTAESANYGAVAGGATDHAEAIEITYDASKLSYGTLLRVFFASHDPTQLNRQGPDVGKQYRSAVFFANDDEKRVAKQYIDQLGQAGAFKNPIVTTLEPLDKFHVAEEYHQDYATRNPDDAYIRFNARPKVNKVKKQFPELLEGSQGDTQGQ